MGFRLGDIAEKTENGILNGTRQEIACDCYFTATGKSIPRWLRIRDEKTGEIHTIQGIESISSEEKCYCGIDTIEHVCRITLNDTKHLVKLIYTKETCKWVLIEI